MKLKTALIYLIPLIWFYHEKQYFKWNLAPQSDVELFADALFWVFCFAALYYERVAAIVNISNHFGSKGSQNEPN